jgi:hypothetical protein
VLGISYHTLQAYLRYREDDESAPEAAAPDETPRTDWL